jgi:hypothetical protein
MTNDHEQICIQVQNFTLKNRINFKEFQQLASLGFWTSSIVFVFSNEVAVSDTVQLL